MADKWRRKREPKHVRLYASLTSSEAWKHLSGNAVKVLLALVARDDGTRNGNIGFSCREAAEATNLAPHTANRCLIELQEKGFIACTEKGGFSRKVSHSTLWRYTWAAWPEGKRGPTRDFEKWTPDGNSRCRNLPVAVSVSTGNMETSGCAVTDFATDELETSHVSVVSNLAKTDTLIIDHGSGRSDSETTTRKQANSSSGAFPDEADELRRQALSYLSRADPGSQTRLAQDAGIPGGTLSKFLSGRGLALHHRTSLSDTIKRNARRAA